MLVSMKRPIITKGRNKTHKFCPRCSELKPISEFHRSITAFDGLQGYCKKCKQESGLQIGGKWYYGLHKRSYPSDGRCEICCVELGNYCYHHWDDDNPSLGISVCGSCDYLAEGLDEIDKNPQRVDIYHRLKEEVERAEKAYVYLYPFLPSNGVRELYSSDGQLTHKWCPRCGRMLPVSEFSKDRYSSVGLVYWCKECRQSTRLNHERGFHKRPKSNCCELCGDSKIHLGYHHWDDCNWSKGAWLCITNKCHYLAEAVDKLDNGSLLPDKYSKLKQSIILEGGLNNASPTNLF